MDVYRVSDTEPSSRITSSPSTSDEASVREPPLSPFGEIRSPGFRALRMMGTTLATASETRIDVFGRSFGNLARCRLTWFVDVPTLSLIQRIEIPRRQIAMIMVCGVSKRCLKLTLTYSTSSWMTSTSFCAVWDTVSLAFPCHTIC